MRGIQVRRRPSRLAVLLAGVATIAATGATAASAQESASAVERDESARPALVHAAEVNECRLNVRTGPEVGASALTTLTCDNYTTCVQSGSEPCAPYVVGGTYSCVGSDGEQVTDNRWAEVAYRAPERAYVAVSCAAFLELPDGKSPAPEAAAVTSASNAAAWGTAGAAAA
ncbi:hypothetical protein [Prauserella rugosa]|uniref:Secreted protein n=1 Tax=Prauserella rugosa TaxID=43354 RepID=A0A660CJU5_9PSEU|nr:hypothetical protein [Prauserella rugosa]TWH22714.1 hypothetical protein JD82_04604 [Prauserella rugosa]